MGKLVVTEFITLDGVIEEPRWSFEFNRGDEGEAFKGDELKAADAQLLGRVTYQGFAKAWPIDARRRLVRREDERHAEVRRLDHAHGRGGGLEQLDGDPRRRRRPGQAAQGRAQR